MNAPALSVRLAVEPAHPAQNSGLEVRGTVHNVSGSAIPARSESSLLLINDEPAANWPLAIGNGMRDPREFALPPGEQIEFQRTLPASSLFQRPGKQEMVLVVEGVPSPAVTIEWQ
jgi:hypothetical protein